jgi:phenylpropionate dioxygenase-like ring-hydroxylating dioxygenase large terminal subunit
VSGDLASRLDAGVTLPFSWFADPEIFRLEQERVFATSWQYAMPTASRSSSCAITTDG